jgi:hypothetical protein
MTSYSHLAKVIAAAALAALISGCAPASPTGEGALASELAGRAAGSPQRCVPNDRLQSLRVVDSRTVLYGSGSTLWVNHLLTECPGADRFDILVVEASGSQFCRGDPIRLTDPITKRRGPVCGLGDFVPYRR